LYFHHWGAKNKKLAVLCRIQIFCNEDLRNHRASCGILSTIWKLFLRRGDLLCFVAFGPMVLKLWNFKVFMNSKNATSVSLYGVKIIEFQSFNELKFYFYFNFGCNNKIVSIKTNFHFFSRCQSQLSDKRINIQ